MHIPAPSADGSLSEWRYEQRQRRLGRNELPDLLAEMWEEGSLDDLDDLAEAVGDAWTSADLPLLALPRHDWVGFFRVLGYTVDGRRNPEMRPTAPLTLFRAATRSISEPLACLGLQTSSAHDSSSSTTLATRGNRCCCCAPRRNRVTSWRTSTPLGGRTSTSLPSATATSTSSLTDTFVTASGSEVSRRSAAASATTQGHAPRVRRQRSAAHVRLTRTAGSAQSRPDFFECCVLPLQREDHPDGEPNGQAHQREGDEQPQQSKYGRQIEHPVTLPNVSVGTHSGLRRKSVRER